MKLGASQSPLKKVFYRMFSLLVVVPLILVSVVAAVILYRVMRSSTVATVSAFQETVATALDTDIKSASLQLSHFVYVNDGEFLDEVNQVYQSTGSQQYLANKALERSFNTSMVPSQNILAGRFFLKGGGTVAVKDTFSLPAEAMRAAGWYSAALAAPNKVVIGGYDTSKTKLTTNTQKGRQLVLVTALAPDYITDRSGNIQVVAYFTTSQVSEVLQRSRAGGETGTTLLLDETGGVLFGDMGRAELLDWFAANGAALPDGTFNRRAALGQGGAQQNYLFIVRAVPFTGWRIVTFVDEGRILHRIAGIGALLAGVAGCRPELEALPTPWERGVWLRSLLRRERERLPRSPAEGADPIQRACQYLADHFADHDLALKTVADQVGLSEKYFSTQFTKRCGCTFSSYLNGLRLRYAQDLLRNTDLKIYQVSDRAGYNSIEHFTHIFKKNLCISPKDYRAQAQNT